MTAITKDATTSAYLALRNVSSLVQSRGTLVSRVAYLTRSLALSGCSCLRRLHLLMRLLFMHGIIEAACSISETFAQPLSQLSASSLRHSGQLGVGNIVNIAMLA